VKPKHETERLSIDGSQFSSLLHGSKLLILTFK